MLDQMAEQDLSARGPGFETELVAYFSLYVACRSFISDIKISKYEIVLLLAAFCFQTWVMFRF